MSAVPLLRSPDISRGFGGVFHGISPDLPDLDYAVARGRLPDVRIKRWRKSGCQLDAIGQLVLRND